MNKCNNCNVSVPEHQAHCPLCNAALGTPKPTIYEYPHYHAIIGEKSVLHSMLWFAAGATFLVCIYIDFFTSSGRAFTMWPVIITASILYLLSMIWVVRAKRKRYGAKVLYSYLFLSAFVITIDFVTDVFLGSTDFVFPLLTLAAIVYLAILSLRSKRLFSEYFGYMLAVIAIGFLSIPIYLFGLNEYEWGAFIANVSSMIIALALYLFADQNVKEEVKKRFHR